jgi:hypothetical protein
MAKYDKSKDVVVAELGEITGLEGFYAEVKEYDGGEPKICVSRRVGKDGEKSRQVFRLPFSDAQGIMVFLSNYFSSVAPNDISED